MPDGATAGAKAAHFDLPPLLRSALNPRASPQAAQTEAPSALLLVITMFCPLLLTPTFPEQQARPQTICAQGQGATTSACQQVPQPVCYGQVDKTTKTGNPKTAEYPPEPALFCRFRPAVLLSGSPAGVPPGASQDPCLEVFLQLYSKDYFKGGYRNFFLLFR